MANKDEYIYIFLSTEQTPQSQYTAFDILSDSVTFIWDVLTTLTKQPAQVNQSVTGVENDASARPRVTFTFDLMTSQS